MLPEKAVKIAQDRDAYLARIPDGDAKDRGVKLGEEMALVAIKARTDDGYGAPNAFRPATQPGVYTETMLTYGWDIATMRPFVMTSPSQFRPPPPIALSGEEWAKNYNEMKEYGEKDSLRRSPRQTEDAKFWLTVSPGSNQPLARQIVRKTNMSIVDSARFMALVTMAQMDAAIAVFDAKYHYTFWRPITAIRNGDIDGNPATDRVAAWQPIALTPLHPEYPCAHCIITGAMAGAITAILGTDEIPESRTCLTDGGRRSSPLHQSSRFQRRSLGSTDSGGISLEVFDRGGQGDGMENRRIYRADLYAALEGCQEVIVVSRSIMRRTTGSRAGLGVKGRSGMCISW